MLADYVERYVRRARRDLLFADTAQELEQTRALVAPAQRPSQTKAAKLS